MLGQPHFVHTSYLYEAATAHCGQINAMQQRNLDLSNKCLQHGVAAAAQLTGGGGGGGGREFAATYAR